jgi:hypothetical protein
MRILILLAAVALGGGCGDDDFNSNIDLAPPVDLSGIAPLDQAALCASNCAPGCDAGQQCYGGTLSDAGAQISAVCLTLCTTTSDCPPPLKCVEPLGATTPPQCMNDDVPMTCGSFTISSCDVPPRCLDDHTLGREFFSANLSVCGEERVYCKDGCVRIDGDGGEEDGGTPACAP